MNMSSNTSNFSDPETPAYFLNRIKFGIFLGFQIPAVICSLYLLSQYAIRHNLRQSIHNHVIIVLLCSSFAFVIIPVSASEAFFFTSHVHPESILFCAIWTWIHYSINISNLILMAFACGERHWLVFRLNVINTRRNRFAYHYIPIMICLIYPWLFHFIYIFLYRCEPIYDYTQLLCLIPCYFLTMNVANLDTFLNNWVPIFAIPLFSGALFIRYHLQKRRTQIHGFRWKRDRRMVIQLLSITLLYCLTWGPVQAATIYDNFFNGGVSTQFEVDFLYSLPNFVHLLYPYVVLLSNPELRYHRNRHIHAHENIQLR